MRRTICLRVCILQLLLFSVILGLSLFNERLGISRDIGEPIFKAIVLILVALSPFGFFSLVLTLAYKFVCNTKETQKFLVGNPVLFFVWGELRSNSGEGK
jgi:thiol:disulfide interchange protein